MVVIHIILTGDQGSEADDDEMTIIRITLSNTYPIPTSMYVLYVRTVHLLNFFDVKKNSFFCKCKEISLYKCKYEAIILKI